MEKEIIKYNKEGLPIRIQQLTMRRDISYRGMHSHGAIEIITVKSGIVTCYIGEDRVSAGANQVILINSNVCHTLTSGDAEIIYLQIDIRGYTDYVDQSEFAPLHAFVFSSQTKSYQVFSDDDALGEILEKLYNRYHEKSQASRLYLKAYIYELVAFLLSQSFIQSEPRIETKKIESIVRYIDSHFRQPITLDDICIGVGYNKYALCHTFKAVTGQTVFSYINFLRIQAAARILEEKKYTITEIATECGFSSAAYFNRVFKTVMGCAPSQYRKYI